MLSINKPLPFTFVIFTLLTSSTSHSSPAFHPSSTLPSKTSPSTQTFSSSQPNDFPRSILSYSAHEYLEKFRQLRFKEFPPGVAKIHQICNVNQTSKPFYYDFLSNAPSSSNSLQSTRLQNFDIVALLPFDSLKKHFSYHNSSLYSIEKVFPSVLMALEKIGNEGLLPRGYHFKFLYSRDDLFDHSKALNTAIQLVITNQANLFLGPVADYALAPILRQCNFWDIPMITPGGMSNEIGNGRNSSYRMITRVGITFDSLIDFVIKILAHHNWYKVNELRFIVYVSPFLFISQFINPFI